MDNATVSTDEVANGGARNTRRLWIGVAAGTVILAALAWWLVGRSNANAVNKDATTPPLITVIYPKLAEIAATVSVTGTISAQNDMPIGVDGEGGRIAEVKVEPGDHVKQGQLLARLDPFVAQSQVDAAIASLEELRASAAVAQAEYARVQKLSDVLSVEETERRRTAAVTAQAKTKLAEAQLQEARTRLARTNVVAPTDGLVLTRTAEVGQIALPGSAVLFHLARGSAIEMRGQVAEQDMPRLKVGQQVKVYLDGAPQAFIGKVWQVGAVIDTTSRQGMVRIELPKAEVNLRPGAFARAEIDVGKTSGMVVPQTAVLSDDAGTYAMVVDQDQRIVRRSVTVGGAHPQGLILTGGLTNDQRVVAIAGAFLRSGEKVAIAANNTSASSGSTASLQP